MRTHPNSHAKRLDTNGGLPTAALTAVQRIDRAAANECRRSPGRCARRTVCLVGRSVLIACNGFVGHTSWRNGAPQDRYQRLLGFPLAGRTFLADVGTRCAGASLRHAGEWMDEA